MELLEKLLASRGLLKSILVELSFKATIANFFTHGKSI